MRPASRRPDAVFPLTLETSASWMLEGGRGAWSLRGPCGSGRSSTRTFACGATLEGRTIHMQSHSGKGRAEPAVVSEAIAEPRRHAELRDLAVAAPASQARG